ncbi:MAG: ATP synthase F1 subunit gamma [Bacteroidales bacterium]|nr:ATP synthase F1 subunit gamma [Bacteroidales bacterium]
MASLRETKDRIGSVRSTLKITSAMKLVASAKLRKAQKAIEGMRPYERTLAEILASVGTAEAPKRTDGNYFSDRFAEKPISDPSSATPTHASAVPSSANLTGESPAGKTAIVAIASNSSLCGAFNANVIRKALEAIRACEGEVEVYPLGRKMAEALRREGYAAPADYNELIGHPSYERSAELARSLAERFRKGELSGVVLVYNRFLSASRQEPVVEQYLPFEQSSSFAGLTGEVPADDYIIEPDAEALLASLLPQVLMLKFHAAVLDSAAAEQAARTIAMQTASDNAEELLGELTLEYNKGRQQKITSEILDLLGGAQ